MTKSVLGILFLATITLAQAAPPPEVEATLCQGWDARLRPMGPTATFATDNATIRLVVKSKEAWPAGNVLKSIIAKKVDGKLVAVNRGQDFKTDGKSNAFGTGIKIAGQSWLMQGGDFVYLIYWNDVQKPIVVAPFTVRTAKRYALLVGITDYPPAGRHKGDGDLYACDKDAKRMHDLLRDSYGFRPENMRLVLNLDATAARLEKELLEIAKKAGPDDVVVFYYSGHGTQIPDLDGDEPDGWDEALATADAKPKLMTTMEHMKLVLSDDRIAELLAQFKTKNVTVIFDSCHSGTAVRAGEGEEIDGEEYFYKGMKREQGFGRKLVEAAEDADRSNAKGVAKGLDIDQRYVFLSAARSWETGMTDGNGCFFSRYLRNSLAYSDGKSWAEIIDEVRPHVQGRNPGQSPQADGAIRRYPFSLAETPADAKFERATVAAVGGWDANKGWFTNKVEKGKTVYVSGMASLYLESGGTLYDVYPSGADGLGSKPRGRVRLTGKKEALKRPRAGPLTYASAIVIDGTVHRGDRLVPLMVRVPEQTPAIGFTYFKNITDAGKRQMSSWTNSILGAIKKESGVRLLRQGEKVNRADYIIVPTVVNGKVVAIVYTPTSIQLGAVSGNPNTVAKSVMELVTHRHETFARFNRISNPSASFRMRVVADGGEGPRKAGSGLKCKGYVSKPAYLYAFYAVHGSAPMLAIATSKPIRPDEQFTFSIPVRPDWKGRLLVKVIASEKPLNLGAINKVAANQRTATLLRELQRVYPAPGGSRDFIGTHGWADHTVWYEFN